MKIAVLTASQLILDHEFVEVQKDFLLKDFQKDLLSLAQAANDQVKKDSQENKLSLFQYNIIDLADLKVNFFSNIINLPYNYAKKYSEFFSDGAKVEVKFYFAVDSSLVNKSKLWIAEINDLSQDVAKIQQLLLQAQKNLIEKKDEENLSNEKSSKK